MIREQVVEITAQPLCGRPLNSCTPVGPSRLEIWIPWKASTLVASLKLRSECSGAECTQESIFLYVTFGHLLNRFVIEPSREADLSIVPHFVVYQEEGRNRPRLRLKTRNSPNCRPCAADNIAFVNSRYPHNFACHIVR